MVSYVYDVDGRRVRKTVSSTVTDALLLARTPEGPITCETCGRMITPQVVDNTESVSVQNPESGEWQSHHVQGYVGTRAPWTPRVGDKVEKGFGNERWRIESIEKDEAVLKLLGNNKETGAPVELNHRKRAPLSVLRYMPD